MNKKDRFINLETTRRNNTKNRKMKMNLDSFKNSIIYI